MLKIALDLAAKFHDNQLDKSGAPYIMHPTRVMLACNTDEERIVAILHDLLEHTTITQPELALKGFSEEILDAVVALTKLEDDIYDDYIDRVLDNPLACRVKLADLCDNSALILLSDKLKKKDLRRLEKYQRAARRIIKHLAEQQGVLKLTFPDGYYGERLKKFIKTCYNE